MTMGYNNNTGPLQDSNPGNNWVVYTFAALVLMLLVVSIIVDIGSLKDLYHSRWDAMHPNLSARKATILSAAELSASVSLVTVIVYYILKRNKTMAVLVSAIAIAVMCLAQVVTYFMEIPA